MARRCSSFCALGEGDWRRVLREEEEEGGVGVGLRSVMGEGVGMGMGTGLRSVMCAGAGVRTGSVMPEYTDNEEGGNKRSKYAWI